LEGPGESRALGVAGFLAPAHVGLEAFPVVSFLPGRRVPCCTVLQTWSVREDGKAWSVEPCFLGRRGFFLNYDCSLQGGCLLQ